MKQAANEKIIDGLIRQNIVLVSGLVLAPVIAAATSYYNALLICFAFSMISFLTILLCRAVPRKIAYTLRVILYAVAASVVYIPVMIICEYFFAPNIILSVGIYIPIMITNSLILSKTETRFYLGSFRHMLADSALFILGFDVVCMAVGILRDILVNGKLGGLYLNMPFSVPALGTTFGGFIFVGILAGLFRAVTARVRERRRIKENRAVLENAVAEAVAPAAIEAEAEFSEAEISADFELDKEDFTFELRDNSNILSGIQSLVDDTAFEMTDEGNNITGDEK